MICSIDVDSFEIHEARRLFQILAILALKDGESNTHLNELIIFLKKKCSSHYESQRRIGIIGMIVFSVQYSKHKTIIASCYAIGAQYSIKSVDLLGELLKTCSKSSKDMCILLDELSESIHNSSKDKQNTKLTLQDDILEFITDSLFELMEGIMHQSQEAINSTVSEYFAFVDDSHVSIELYPPQDLLYYVPSLLRLMNKDEYAIGNNMESFELLLGCPVLLPKEISTVGMIRNEKKDLLDALYHCVNWYRYASC